ncbi:hypothetical protein MTO96_002421 [Rhipicephalus appendiculatus]
MMQLPIKDGVVSSPYPPVELIDDERLYQHIKKRFLEHGDKPALVESGDGVLLDKKLLDRILLSTPAQPSKFATALLRAVFTVE